MEDMAWVLYALVGTQIVLILMALWCRNTLVLVTNDMRKEQIEMHKTLVDINSRLAAMREDWREYRWGD